MAVRSLGCVACVCLALLAGCSRRPGVPDYGSPEGKEIAAKFDGLVEDKSRPARYKNYFVQGAAPANAAAVKKFASFEYDLVGRPAVSGDTATTTVKVRKADGSDAGQVEWTFVKEGNAWKIKSAPLP